MGGVICFTTPGQRHAYPGFTEKEGVS